MNTAEICNDQQRRRNAVRNPEKLLCGLDYVEVSPDQLVLTVYFLGKAPKGLTPENVVIEGGRRIRNIKVVDIDPHYTNNPDFDDYVDVTVDKAGDFSTYTLKLVQPAVDAEGKPRYTRLPGIELRYAPVYTRLAGVDQRYAQVDFSFKAGCASDLDCSVVNTCPPTPVVQPEINYLAKDYTTFRQLLLDRLTTNIPDWQESHIPDIGIVLVEVMAYAADYISYYQDAVSTEAYLGTARQRISVRRHVRLIDYHMHEGCNARTWVCVETSVDLADGKLLPGDCYFLAGGKHCLQE